MLKDITVVSLISLGILGVGGCRSHDHMESHSPMAVEETMHTTSVAVDDLPDDVVRAVHEHVLQPRIISAETVMWKSKMAYKVYVKSGNTVYILKLRPDGYYLDMTVDRD